MSSSHKRKLAIIQQILTFSPYLNCSNSPKYAFYGWFCFCRMKFQSSFTHRLWLLNLFSLELLPIKTNDINFGRVQVSSSKVSLYFEFVWFFITWSHLTFSSVLWNASKLEVIFRGLVIFRLVFFFFLARIHHSDVIFYMILQCIKRHISSVCLILEMLSLTVCLRHWLSGFLLNTYHFPFNFGR